MSLLIPYMNLLQTVYLQLANMGALLLLSKFFQVLYMKVVPSETATYTGLRLLLQKGIRVSLYFSQSLIVIACWTTVFLFSMTFRKQLDLTAFTALVNTVSWNWCTNFFESPSQIKSWSSLSTVSVVIDVIFLPVIKALIDACRKDSERQFEDSSKEVYLRPVNSTRQESVIFKARQVSERRASVMKPACNMKQGLHTKMTSVSCIRSLLAVSKFVFLKWSWKTRKTL